MRRFGYSVIHLIQLIRYFGAAGGAGIFFKIVFASETAIVSSKKFKNKVEIRKKDSDLPIFYQVFAELQYDIAYNISFVPTRIIDCGANVGYASLYLAALFPGAEIVAVEPQQNNFAQLKKNTASYKNIHSVNAAIWHRKADMFIKNKEELSAGFEVGEGNAGEPATLKSITIEGLMEDNNFGAIDILKIDIEGAEYELFANNPHIWLAKTQCLVIELHDNLKPGTSQVFFREMAKYKWNTVIRGENIICFKA